MSMGEGVRLTGGSSARMPAYNIKKYPPNISEDQNRTISKQIKIFLIQYT